VLKDFLTVARPLGLLQLGFTVAFLPPLALAVFEGPATRFAFGVGLIANLVCGAALWAVSRKARRELRSRDGFLLVALSWILLASFAAVPLLLAIEGISFTDAYFESMSGLTTTGATILKHIDPLPRSIKLWRCGLSWIGGLGILGLGMAVLPLLGVGGMQVYRAESTGPIKDAKLTPRFAQTARSLGVIYVVLTAVCFFALLLAGMGGFDALCHALSVLSLGGFSTRDDSIGAFASPAIEIVLMIAMILSATNFATHFLAWRGKSLRPYLRDVEATAMLALLLVSVAGLALYIDARHLDPDYWVALRQVAFNLVSVALGCGLYNADYDGWPIAAGLWLLLLSCITASAGSTGGGIKMIRTLILFKQSGRELFALVHPSSVRTLKIGGQPVPDRVTLSVFGFIHLYTISIVVLSFVLIVSGMDLLSAFSSVIATINNVGPGLNLVGPGESYATLTDFQTWVCTFSMLLGRLEIFLLVVPLTPAFWRD
jgi:trk system potassium uptake protein TrkH